MIRLSVGRLFSPNNTIRHLQSWGKWPFLPHTLSVLLWLFFTIPLSLRLSCLRTHTCSQPLTTRHASVICWLLLIYSFMSGEEPKNSGCPVTWHCSPYIGPLAFTICTVQNNVCVTVGFSEWKTISVRVWFTTFSYRYRIYL